MAEFTARTRSPPPHVTHLELRADDMAPKEVEAELFETAEWCNNFSAKLRRMGLPRAAFFQQSSFATHAQATERLVTFYEFSDIKLAFAGAEAGRAIKPILRMS